MEKEKRSFKSVGTPEQLSQFWNHRVHPITGYINTGTSHISQSEREAGKRRSKLLNNDNYI